MILRWLGVFSKKKKREENEFKVRVCECGRDCLKKWHHPDYSPWGGRTGGWRSVCQVGCFWNLTHPWPISRLAPFTPAPRPIPRIHTRCSLFLLLSHCLWPRSSLCVRNCFQQVSESYWIKWYSALQTLGSSLDKDYPGFSLPSKALPLHLLPHYPT